MTDNKSKIKAARRGDWKTKPMPDQHETFVLRRSFDGAEMAALRLGNIPQSMEDKWFWYMEGSTLWAHRSWTGYCIYRIELNEDDAHVVTVNRDPQQYTCTSIEEDIKSLNGLLDWWTKAPYDYYNEWLSETLNALEKSGRARKSAGNKALEYTHHYDSPLGGITLASDGEVLTGLWFDGQKYFADTLEKDHEEKPLPVFEEADRWLSIYFSGKAPDFTPPLKMKTTPFRRAVWEILLTIPYGKTMTYGQIADRLVKEKGFARMSAQAIGGAVGHNAISLIIPCHRVVGADGSLTGYAGGIDKKAKLLEMEGADIPPLSI